LQVYQIHVGQTKVLNIDKHYEQDVFRLETTETEGWLSADGWCTGSYLHGLFENDSFRHGVVAALAKRRFPQQLYLEPIHFSRQQEYDRLADVLRQHLDLKQVKELMGLAAGGR
jgi:adenosylcobyric acid synthase